ncbi:hypothetical protein OIU76_016342 [Salix suchowensis]|nr:hypothetical protein OIU76_016342 [Salix suchowensis]
MASCHFVLSRNSVSSFSKPLRRLVKKSVFSTSHFPFPFSNRNLAAPTLSSLSLISLSQIVSSSRSCVLSSLASNLSPPSVPDPLLLCTSKPSRLPRSLGPSAALQLQNVKTLSPLASLSPSVPLLLCNYKTLSPPSASLIFVPLAKGLPHC